MIFHMDLIHNLYFAYKRQGKPVILATATLEMNSTAIVGKSEFSNGLQSHNQLLKKLSAHSSESGWMGRALLPGRITSTNCKQIMTQWGTRLQFSEAHWTKSKVKISYIQSCHAVGWICIPTIQNINELIFRSTQTLKAMPEYFSMDSHFPLLEKGRKPLHVKFKMPLVMCHLRPLHHLSACKYSLPLSRIWNKKFKYQHLHEKRFSLPYYYFNKSSDTLPLC